MSEQPSLAGKPPLVLNKTLFVLTMLALVASACTLIGIPFSIAGLIYVLYARKQATALLGDMAQSATVAAQAEQRASDAEARTVLAERTLSEIGGMEVLDRQRFVEQLDAEIADRRGKVRGLEAEITAASEHAAQLRTQVVDLQGALDVQDYGLYNFENPAQDSTLVGEDLKRIQSEIKECVRNKFASRASTTFTLNDSVSKGQKMVNDMSKLLLRAFNAEAENCVKTVKQGKLHTAQTRLEKASQAVERLGKSMDIQITRRFLELRTRELELTHKHLLAVQALKEEERAERERQRDEAQAKKEFEAAKAKQQKEVTKFQAALEQLRSMGDDEGAAKVEAQLVAAQELLEDIRERMTQTRAGHVYVISNVGAFGRGMVKIGMTRRMTPEDRIRELGDASVPFLFDQHAMIFSPDAFGLETALHQHFADRRVNLVNLRREYFYATPSEVKEALSKIGDAHVLEFNEQWRAPEFNESIALREQQGLPSVPAHSLAGLMSPAGA